MKSTYKIISTIVLATTTLLSKNTSAQGPIRKVLLEEFTTCSCGNCPPVSKKVGDWHDAHNENTILVTIHEGSGTDGMSTTTTKAIFDAMHPNNGWFAPAIMIDRGVYKIGTTAGTEAYMTASDFGSSTTPKRDSIALRLMAEPAKAAIGIKGTYNPSTGLLSATVDVNFIQSLPSGDWRINLFLVEDKVVGTPHLGAFAGGYDQHCYNSTWATTNYGSMFDGESIIGYPHRHVMRNALLGNWGKSAVIPSVPALGTTYSTSTTFTVPSTYKVEDLTLVAFVSSYAAITSSATHTSNISKNYVVNANEVHVSETFNTTSVDDQIASINKEVSINNVYPNPSAGESNLEYYLSKAEGKVEITMTDVLGHVVKVIPSQNQVGSNKVSFTTSDVAKGIYYINVTTKEYKAVEKILVQ